MKERSKQSLTASRTGMPVLYDYEINEGLESRKSIWLMVIVILVAFVMVLQMDSNSLTAKSSSNGHASDVWTVN